MKPPAPLFDVLVAVSDSESAVAVQSKLAAHGVKRVVLAGLGPDEIYADVTRALTDAGYELLLIAEAAPTDSAAQRAILDARAAGATLTDAGQCTALLGSHYMRSALVLVGDPGPAAGLTKLVRNG